MISLEDLKEMGLAFEQKDFNTHPDYAFQIAHEVNQLLLKKLEGANIPIKLNTVDVRKFDDESIWLQRPDGEGMQLPITEEWWNNNM